MIASFNIIKRLAKVLVKSFIEQLNCTDRT
nr:MAG TPA: hypothetical protein [Caudoviricetes sp.]